MAAPSNRAQRPSSIGIEGPVDLISAPTPDRDTAERVRHTSRIKQMGEYFAKQPKENIKIRKDDGEQFVQINGYTFQIQAGVPVPVPRDVAELLRAADII